MAAVEPAADGLEVAEAVEIDEVTQPVAPLAAAAGRIASAALLIAVLTVVSRLAGLARTGVLSWAVGYTKLSDVYLAANTIPNIIFEIVAGGALAALVVPLLAGPIGRADTATASRTASALLGWVLVLLVPLALLLAIAARPVMWLLLHGHASPAALDVGTHMLWVFAPQLPLYGIGIVLTGVLQSHHRFAWPVLAPLLSSLTVIAAYLTFGVTQPAGVSVAGVSWTGQLILSVGTTLGVVVLTLCLVVPVRRLGLHWRFSLRFEPATALRVRSLALVGLLTVVAQQIALLVAIVLVQWHAADGSLVIFNQAQTVYLLPWAVLAVPLATSAYPVLARSVVDGEQARFRQTLAGAGRGVLFLSAMGAAALVAVARPMAQLLGAVSSHTSTPATTRTLTATIIALAPGLLGYGLFALYSRALYAQGRNRTAAYATLIGWGTVIAVSVLLGLIATPAWRVPAVAAGNSVGMLVLAVVLVVLVTRGSGRPAVAGLPRIAVVSLVGGTVAAVAGLAVRWPLTGAPGAGGAVVHGMLSGVVVGVVYLGVVALLDRRQVVPLLTGLYRRIRPARRPGAEVPDGADAARTAGGGTNEKETG